MQNHSNSSRGLSQAGYRVAVYKNRLAGQQLLWDSGHVPSPRSSRIACGAALPPFSDLIFEAEWWRSDGAVSAKARMPFKTGPFSAADWGDAAFLRGTLLRAQLQIPANTTVQRARAFVAAPGCHALEVNNYSHPWTYAASARSCSQAAAKGVGHSFLHSAHGCCTKPIT
jgi:hypothetical protein